MTRDQELRDEALMQLAAAFPGSRPAERLYINAKRAGLECTAADFDRACAYLAGLSPALVERVINPATNATTYKATSAGVAHHERFGN
jgi:hypothetical protein